MATTTDLPKVYAELEAACRDRAPLHPDRHITIGDALTWATIAVCFLLLASGVL